MAPIAGRQPDPIVVVLARIVRAVVDHERRKAEKKNAA
jgi:hypothetical protein